MTSSNGNIFCVTGPLCVSPVTGEFPSPRPVTRSFDVFFDLRLSKRMSKQWRRRWFDTPSHSLWRHCNGAESAHGAADRHCLKICQENLSASPKSLGWRHAISFCWSVNRNVNLKNILVMILSKLATRKRDLGMADRQWSKNDLSWDSF